MKLLKTIGKVIALPFDLALILGKLLLIPIKLVSVLLHGEFIEWNKKRKFAQEIQLKKCLKLSNIIKIILSYIQQDLQMKMVNFSERIETFKVTSDSMQHYINYAKTSLKQESA